MPGSNTTKHIMADALKDLMLILPFERISVSHICETCNMNRKSFYYHFKDKYDLVNWIFDVECISLIISQNNTERWTFLETLAQYFYENKNYYQKIFKIQGQNSFIEHFREFLYPIVCQQLSEILASTDNLTFMSNFISDAYICAIERWLSEKDCMAPAQFMHIIKSLTESIAIYLCTEMKENGL